MASFHVAAASRDVTAFCLDQQHVFLSRWSSVRAEGCHSGLDQQARLPVPLVIGQNGGVSLWARLAARLPVPLVIGQSGGLSLWARLAAHLPVLLVIGQSGRMSPWARLAARPPSPLVIGQIGKVSLG